MPPRKTTITRRIGCPRHSAPCEMIPALGRGWVPDWMQRRISSEIRMSKAGASSVKSGELFPRWNTASEIRRCSASFKPGPIHARSTQTITDSQTAARLRSSKVFQRPLADFGRCSQCASPSCWPMTRFGRAATGKTQQARPSAHARAGTRVRAHHVWNFRNLSSALGEVARGALD